MNERADRVDVVVLAWLWCQRGKPKKAAVIVKAMGGAAPLLPDGRAGALVDEALDRLTRAGQVQRVEPKKKGAPTFALADAGRQRLGTALGRAMPTGEITFGKMKDVVLSWVAAGLPGPIPPKATATTVAKRLLLPVCAAQFDLDVPPDAGPEQAKIVLVKLALAKAQGLPPDRIHLKKVGKDELPALVVAPLLGAAGTAASSLDKLIEATALRLLGVSAAKAVPGALVRRWLGGGAEGGAFRPAAERGGTPPAAPTGPAPAPPPARSDDRTFAQHALAAARAVARDGGEGLSNLGDKVLVHHAWRRYERLYGPVPLDEFKRRLALVNGEHLVLVREDLVPDARRGEFADSEVRAGISSYHYIRL